MHKLGKVTLKQCWYVFLILAIPFICVAGVSYIPFYLRFPLIIVVSLGSFFISTVMSKKISFNAISGLWLGASVIMCASCMYSYARSETLTFGIVFMSCSFLLFADFSENLWSKIISVINVIVIIIAISIIASVFIEGLMVNQLGFLINPKHDAGTTQAILAELKLGSYSGLAREKAEAALIMNVGIAILFSKYFSGTKCNIYDVVELGILAVALILTGKRMLFLIPIMLFVILMLMSKIKYRLLKFVVIVLLACCCVIVMSAFIPQMEIMYQRFIGNQDSAYYDVLSGRGDLWKYSFMMFAENPIFGVGYGAYNLYAFYHGYLYQGSMWRYYGHNCYYEMLGEVGIVGALIIFGLFAAALALTVKYMRNKNITCEQRRLLMFSFYIQVMFFIYCASANVLYQYEQIFMWFTAVAIMLTFHRRLNGNIRTLKG